jgi:hypothetical protein
VSTRCQKTLRKVKKKSLFENATKMMTGRSSSGNKT